MYKRFTNIKRANQHPRKDLLSKINSYKSSIDSNKPMQMPCNSFNTIDCKAVQQVKLLYETLYPDSEEPVTKQDYKSSILLENLTEFGQDPNETVRDYLPPEDNLALDALAEIELPHKYSHDDGLYAMGFHITPDPNVSSIINEEESFLYDSTRETLEE